jgi:hypothetical protein
MMAATIIGMTGLSAQAQPLDDLSFLLPVWDSAFNLHTGAGYKDNVTLSHTATQSSPFFTSTLEAIITRLPKEGTQFNLLLSADDRRYFGPGSVDKEQFAFAQIQVKQVYEQAGEASLAADYVYLDQIQDVSATETNLQAVRVRGHTLIGRPGLRLNFSQQWWASVELVPTRQWLAAPLGDFTEFGARVVIGKDYGHKSEISLRYEPGYRDYDTEPELTAAGEPVPGALRSFSSHEARLNWKHHWDSHREWRTVTRLSYKINDDQGAGYFDYTKISVSEQIRYRTKHWEISAEGKMSYYDYAVQTVSASSSEHRKRTDLGIKLQVERQLTNYLTLIGAYELERALSNISAEDYLANTISGSLQWSF